MKLKYLIFAGMFRIIKQRSPIPVFVMIRPRGGDFLYTENEFEVMKEDVKIFKEAGADGVVFGILTRCVSVRNFLTAVLFYETIQVELYAQVE